MLQTKKNFANFFTVLCLCLKYLCLFSDALSLAREFSSGFLLGEVLNKYQLQDDFEKFSQARYSIMNFIIFAINQTHSCTHMHAHVYYKHNHTHTNTHSVHAHSKSNDACNEVNAVRSVFLIHSSLLILFIVED
jgi:hypothetical protein